MKYDMTSKLSFDENPKIIIKDKEIEVNADAETILLVMGDFANKLETEAMLSSYARLFGEEERKAIADMKLPFKDLTMVIEAAMSLAQGEAPEDAEGEAPRDVL